MSLHHNGKGKLWTVITRNEIHVQKNQYNYGYIFPCNDKCLVAPCCNLYCHKVFNYMNFIADRLSFMKDDEQTTYEETTPMVIKTKIQEYHSYGRRLAYPEKCTVTRNWT